MDPRLCRRLLQHRYLACVVGTPTTHVATDYAAGRRRMSDAAMRFCRQSMQKLSDSSSVPAKVIAGESSGSSCGLSVTYVGGRSLRNVRGASAVLPGATSTMRNPISSLLGTCPSRTRSRIWLMLRPHISAATDGTTQHDMHTLRDKLDLASHRPEISASLTGCRIWCYIRRADNLLCIRVCVFSLIIGTGRDHAQVCHARRLGYG